LPNELREENDPRSLFRASANIERLRWREWPCPACSRGITPFGYLVGRISAGPKLQSSSVEEQIKLYSDWLKDWVRTCPHSAPKDVTLPKITEGSEHAVFFCEQESSVYKLTLPGIFGDTYRLQNGVVHQDKSDPLLYLVRLRLWDKLFRSAPESLGITEPDRLLAVKSSLLENAPPKSP
jgi:hypothetical protein